MNVPIPLIARRVSLTRVLCLGMIGSNMSMWIAAVYTMSIVNNAMAQGGTVPQDTITITLPVFIVSILATAGFTWAVAQHDRQNDKRIDVATAEVESRVTAKVEDLEATLNKLLRRLGSKDITDT